MILKSIMKGWMNECLYKGRDDYYIIGWNEDEGCRIKEWIKDEGLKEGWKDEWMYLRLAPWSTWYQ